MLGSGTDTCRVRLITAASSGGESVSFSNHNAAAQVPAKVTVSAGAISVQFTANLTGSYDFADSSA
jgi:hypothetical protein